MSIEKIVEHIDTIRGIFKKYAFENVIVDVKNRPKIPEYNKNSSEQNINPTSSNT